MSITSAIAGDNQAPDPSTVTGAIAKLPGGKGLAAAETSLMAGLDKKRELDQQEAGEIGKARGKLDALTPPTLDKLPDAPTAPAADPLKAFGTPAVWLAVLGGMLTRRSLTNSLNAAAAAMGALRQNDMDTYKQKYDEWKVNTENAIKLQNFKTQAYEEAVSKITTDARLAQVQLETAAHSFGDTTMVKLAQTNMDEALKYQEAQARMSESLGRSSTALQEKHSEVMLLSDLTAARKGLAVAQKTNDPAAIADAQQKVADAHQAIMDHAEVKYPGVVTAEMRASVDQAGGGLIDADTVKTMAQQRIAGDKSAAQGMGYGKLGQENRQRFNVEVAKQLKEQGLTGADLATATAQFTAEEAGERTASIRQANVLMAANEASRFIDLSKEAYAKLPRGQFVPFNRLQQLYETNTSSPEQGAAYTADFSLVNAYVRAVSPTGVPPESLREHALQLLSTVDGPERHTAVLDQFKREMDAAMKSPGTVMETFGRQITGRPGGGGAQPAPPPEAVQMLKADPSSAAHFDQVFGPGAAARALGQ